MCIPIIYIHTNNVHRFGRIYYIFALGGFFLYPASYIADFMYIPVTNNIGPSGYIAYLHLGGLFANVGPTGYISLPAPWVEGLLGSICIPGLAAYIACL
jgi:hypothetical protein